MELKRRGDNMNQVKVFHGEKELNVWLSETKYEIIDIQFQFQSASYYRYMVWYKI
jgi:hypothetical protein